MNKRRDVYKVLGSDGNEYGPVSARQIKRWIAENRVEQKTPVIYNGANDWVFLGSVPEFKAIFVPPPLGTTPAGTPPKSGIDLNGLIPYKNVWALLAYYFAVFSIIPVLGMPLGFVGLTLGIAGLRFERRHPATGGKVHAWIGILLGGLCGFGYLGLIIWGLVGMVVGKRWVY